MQTRSQSNGVMSAVRLEDKFEVLKDIGDGSFGSVVLARVRTAGSHVARRGSVVSGPGSQVYAAADVVPGCDQDNEENL
jgi:meiosis induction protein kinase IME2/SME1